KSKTGCRPTRTSAVDKAESKGRAAARCCPCGTSRWRRPKSRRPPRSAAARATTGPEQRSAGGQICSGCWRMPPPAPEMPMALADASRSDVVGGGIGEELLGHEQQYERAKHERAEVVAGRRDFILLVLIREVIGDFKGIKPC